MSWSALSLSSPVSDASGLDFKLASFSVSPWSHGVAEGNSDQSWLSFPNAVEAVIKLVPTDAQALFAVAVSAASLGDLAGQVAILNSALPLKQLKQWQRQAGSLAKLQLSKFDLLEQVPSLGTLALNALPTVKQQMEKAISQAALAEAEALVGVDPLAALTAFAVDKSAHDALVNAALPALSGGAGWRFYAESDFANNLRTGHPGDDQSLTVMLAFVGSPSELSFLVEMMP